MTGGKPFKFWPLDRILLFGELVAAVAVVVSVIFVAIEVRQNSQAQVQATTQAAMSNFLSSLELMASDREFACMYTRAVRDFEALDAAERLRFSAYYMSTYYQLQEMHRLAEEGAMDADTWSAFHGLLQETTRYPGVRQWFAIRRTWFSERFQAYVDELMRQAPGIEAAVFDDANSCSEAA